MVSFFQVSPPEPCAHLFTPPYAPHVPLISFFSILPPAYIYIYIFFFFYCDLTLTTRYSLSHCYWTSGIFCTVQSCCFAFSVIRTCVKLEHSKNSTIYFTLATRSALGWGTALQAGMVSFEFFIDVILPAAVLHLGWLCRCVGLTTLPPSRADCFEIWEPQPPGTLRACPGL
jgi:hypothetical protein